MSKRQLTGSHIIHASVTGINSSDDAQLLLIDLSDTTNFDHGSTGHLNIDAIHTVLDPTSSFKGTIRYGFLSGVNQTDADVKIVDGYSVVNKNRAIDEAVGMYPHSIQCVNDEHFGKQLEGYGAFNSTVKALKADNTSEACGDGDFVAIVAPTAGTTDVMLSVWYRSEPS